MTLGQRTARGVAWNYVSYGLGKALILVTTAILARLLVPDDFGLVAIATVAVTYLAIIQDAGLAGALIYRRHDTERSANVVFTINVALGALLAGATILFAPWVARFFGDPEVTALLRVLGLTFLIAPLGSTHRVRLERELEFRKKVVPDVGNALAKGVVAISLAFAGFGAWSLIWGQIAGVSAGVLLSWAVVPWRPHFVLDRRLARSLLAFGVPLLAVDAIHVTTVTIDYVVVGRVIGTAALGLYTVAFRIPEVLVLSTIAALNRVVFPAFASVQHDREALRRGFLKSVRFVAMITVPVCLGLILTAKPLILVFLGEDWVDATPLLRVLALYAAVAIVTSTDGDVYKATGHLGVLVKLGLVQLALLLPAVYVGARFGLMGVALALLAVTAVIVFIRIAIVSRYVATTVPQVLGQIGPAVMAGVVMSITVVPTLLATAGKAPVVQLGAAVVVGTITYATGITLIDRRTIREGVALLRRVGDADVRP